MGQLVLPPSHEARDIVMFLASSRMRTEGFLVGTVVTGQMIPHSKTNLMPTLGCKSPTAFSLNGDLLARKRHQHP